MSGKVRPIKTAPGLSNLHYLVMMRDFSISGVVG